jgi:RNA polymerase sigma-70 factor (ECF subfamily)
MYNEMPRADISYEETVHKYIDTVYRVALAQTASKTDAEDVVQDVFLRFLKETKPFESEEHIKAWLIRVAINCSKKLFSTSWFKKTVPLSEDIPFEQPEHSEVYYALQALPSKYRIPLYLYYYEEYSVREISECLRVKEGTIKSQLSRGRELLKENLKGDGADV